MEFDEIIEGKVEMFKHKITEEDVNTFAKLTGDYNPVHMDEDFALKTNFGKRVVHGMLTSSFISTMIGMRIPGEGALWLSQTLNFLNPTFIGDTIEVIAVVKNVSQSLRTFKMNIKITNQIGTELVNGQAHVKVLDTRKKKAMMTKNNIVLITGGARGIGAATAKELIKQGYFVIVNYFNDNENASKLIKELNINKENSIGIKADVSNIEDIKKLFSNVEENYGKILKIVHCATPNPIPMPFLNQSWDSFEEQQNVQLKGAFNLAKCALPNMINEKQGVFVNIGTIFTDGTPPLHQSPYISAKAALSSFTKTLAVEYGPIGIRFNTVNPGMTHTQLLSGVPDKIKLLAKMNTPLKILAEPEDIANTIAFLISEKASHITGETIRVCGGIYMD